jgi:hypothetical protein
VSVYRFVYQLVFENEGANHGNGFSTLRGIIVGGERHRVLLLPIGLLS